MTAVVCLGVGVLGPSSPAGAASYTNYLPNNAAVFTTPTNTGNCTWWARYFNYGGTPVAQLRMNGSNCNNYYVRVWGQVGSTKIPGPWVNGWSSYGTDACGGYFEKQSSGSGTQVAIGLDVYTASGVLLEFRHDGIYTGWGNTLC